SPPARRPAPADAYTSQNKEQEKPPHPPDRSPIEWPETARPRLPTLSAPPPRPAPSRPTNLSAAARAAARSPASAYTDSARSEWPRWPPPWPPPAHQNPATKSTD